MPSTGAIAGGGGLALVIRKKRGDVPLVEHERKITVCLSGSPVVRPRNPPPFGRARETS